MIDVAFTQLSVTLVLGFLLGLKHALEADHIAVVSAMVTRSKSLKKSALTGMLWGVGHTTILLLVGFAILIFKLNIPDKLSLYSELLVGIALVFLGANVLKNLGGSMHLYEHEHGKSLHVHCHSRKTSLLHSHGHKTIAIGMLHGLGGSAALTLLILSTLHSVFEGLVYILIFSLGSMLGMTLISFLVGVPFLIAKGQNKVDKIIKSIAGIISIFIGLVIIYQVIVVYKIFI